MSERRPMTGRAAAPKSRRSGSSASRDPFPPAEALLDYVYTAPSSRAAAHEKLRGGHPRGLRVPAGEHSKVFAIGQGLWSPWYVGNSMTDLDIQFGRERIIDTPVSELACTGAALGASLCGYRPVVVHPRVDFMLLAVDQIVTQAAKWRSMFGGQVSAPVTIRAIVNRGGEQGAQHSQALHSWFAHVPGLGW